jgi:D-alanine-D-alanine ligase
MNGRTPGTTGDLEALARVRVPGSLDVEVLFGGLSEEHDVSLVSGRAVAAGLAGRGHPVGGWLVDLERGWWQLPPMALDGALPVTAFREPLALGADGPLSAAAALERMAARSPRPVVFPVMHGPFGEDGEVQSLLASAGLVYCGAGPAASAIGMDKILFKRICASMELPVLPWIEVRADEYATERSRVLEDVRAFAFALPDPRLIVKPAHLGSSIGIGIVHRPADPGQLEDALAEALRHDDLALAESYLDHPRELETSVMGNSRRDTVAFGPGEVVPGREFYDYIAKYHSDDSITTEQAELDPGLAAEARQAAIDVYLAIGAGGFARVDMLLSADGILFISEINTIPGFTPISLFPRMTALGGLDFGATCEQIVALALARATARPGGRPRAEDPA